MSKLLSLVLGIILAFSISGAVQADLKAQAASKSKIIEMNIPTDLPPPPSAEEVAPIHPFFAEPTPANEVMEKVVELEERVSKLEKKEQERTRLESKNSPSTQ